MGRLIRHEGAGVFGSTVIAIGQIKRVCNMSSSGGGVLGGVIRDSAQ